MFWSERWIEHAVAVLLDRRPTGASARRRQIELDSGWWKTAIWTVLDRPRFRLDVRALVEEHGQERCLCRIRMRAHAMAILVPLIAASRRRPLLDAGGLVAWPIAAAVAAPLATAVALTDVVSTSRAVRHAVDQVAAEAGDADHGEDAAAGTDWAGWIDDQTARIFSADLPQRGRIWFFAGGSALVALMSAGVGLMSPWPMKILVDSVLGQEPLPRMLQFANPVLADKFLLLILTVAAGLAITLGVNLLAVATSYLNTKLDLAMTSRLPRRSLPAGAAARWRITTAPARAWSST